MKGQRKLILAASSGGGHWIELLRLTPAFRDCSVAYVTVNKSYGHMVGDSAFYTVNDATRWNPFGLLLLAARMFLLMLTIRPEIVVSTGAAPGYFAVRFGRLFGARTVWVDSLANVTEVSRAGRMAGRYCDLWLTQWPGLASSPAGPRYAGQVI